MSRCSLLMSGLPGLPGLSCRPAQPVRACRAMNSRIEERFETFFHVSTLQDFHGSTAVRQRGTVGAAGISQTPGRRKRASQRASVRTPVTVSKWTSVVVRRSTKPRREPRYFWWAAGGRQCSAATGQERWTHIDGLYGRSRAGCTRGTRPRTQGRQVTGPDHLSSCQDD